VPTPQPYGFLPVFRRVWPACLPIFFDPFFTELDRLPLIGSRKRSKPAT
jgi:hypothetical protein